MTSHPDRIRTLDQIRRFLDDSRAVNVRADDRESTYTIIRQTLVRFEYHRLSKPDKGLVKAYLVRMTGLSRAQLTRLIAQHRRTGDIRDRRRRPGPSQRAASKIGPPGGDDPSNDPETDS